MPCRCRLNERGPHGVGLCPVGSDTYMGFIQRFFIGRNGPDQLNLALLAVSMGFTFLSRVLFGGFFSTLAYVILAICVFRMISRNLERRQRENAWFLQLIRRGGARGQSPRSPDRRGRPDRQKPRRTRNTSAISNAPAVNKRCAPRRAKARLKSPAPNAARCSTRKCRGKNHAI